MTLFNTKTVIEVDNTPSAEEAQSIYDGLKAGKNETDLFKDGVGFKKSAIVIAEMKKLESEMVSKMRGSYILVHEVSHIDEDTQEKVIDVAKECFAVTTEDALKASMSSDLLDINTLVTDVRIYSDNNPDISPDWDTYKASMGE